MKKFFKTVVISVVFALLLCSCNNDKNTVSSDLVSRAEESDVKVGECYVKCPSGWETQISESGNAATLILPQNDGFSDNIFITVTEYDHMLIYYTKEQFENGYKQTYDNIKIDKFDTSMQINQCYTVSLEGAYTQNDMKISFKQYILNYGDKAYSFTASSNDENVSENIAGIIEEVKFD